MIFCHSEEDAKNKLCPVMSTSVGVIDAASFEYITCCASDCMAWRWVETHIKDADGNLTVLSGDTHGYCGLAGREWSKR